MSPLAAATGQRARGRSASPASSSARSRSGSRCRRSPRAPRLLPIVVGLARGRGGHLGGVARATPRRRRRGRRGHLGDRVRRPRDALRTAHLDRSSSGARSAPRRSAMRRRYVRGDRRALLRAQRRHQRRARGDAAHGRVLRHLGRDLGAHLGRQLAWLVGLAAAALAGMALAAIHAVWAITFRPTRSSRARRSISSRSGSPATCSSTSTATPGRRVTSPDYGIPDVRILHFLQNWTSSDRSSASSI